MRVWNSGIGKLLLGLLAAWVGVACSGDGAGPAGDAADATADGMSLYDSGTNNDATVGDSATGTDSSSPSDAVTDTATPSDDASDGNVQTPDASDSGDAGDSGNASDSGDASDSGNASDAGTDASDSGTASDSGDASDSGKASDAGTDANDASTCDDAGHCFDVLSQGTAGAKVGDIVLDTANLFWTERSTGNIMSAPIGGGLSSVIASGQATPLGIGVDATFVYWTNKTGATSGVAKAPKVGGGPTTTLYPVSAAYRLVVDVPRSKIWFVDTAGNMVSMGLDGSSAGEFEGGETNFRAIVVDSSGVYGASESGILGGSGAGGSESFLNTGGVQTPYAMASDSLHLYFVDTGLGHVSSLRKTGGTPTSIAAAGKTTDEPLAMAVTGGFVYWADVATGAVKSVDTAGASQPKTLVNSPATPRGIAVDATWVYWSSDDGAIRRVAH